MSLYKVPAKSSLQVFRVNVRSRLVSIVQRSEIDRQNSMRRLLIPQSRKLSKLAPPNRTWYRAPTPQVSLPEYPLTYKDETRVEKIDFTTRKKK